MVALFTQLQPDLAGPDIAGIAYNPGYREPGVFMGIVDGPAPVGPFPIFTEIYALDIDNILVQCRGYQERFYG
jgi:hypothetical protein